MASIQWKWTALIALCVVADVAQAQYGASYAPQGTPHGVYPPAGSSPAYGVVPPQGAYSTPSFVQQGSQPYSVPPPGAGANAHGAHPAQAASSTRGNGYPLNYQMARQDDAANPNPMPEMIPTPSVAPPQPAASPRAQDAPVVEIQQGAPVYGGAPTMNYRDVAQGYVQEALTNCQPAGTTMSPWSNAQYGHAHRGCGPTYPAWGGNAGAGRPRMGERLKGRLVGDSGACEPYGVVACDAGPKWFASAYGLLLKRSKGPFHPLSEDTAASAISLSSSSVSYPYQGGVEVRFGRYLNPELALEGAWWTLFDEPVESTIYGSDYAAGLSSRVDYSALDIVQGGGPAANVQSYYDGAWMHRVRRSFALTNVELNVLQIPICGSPCSACGGCDSCGVPGSSCGASSSRLNLSWHVGARYLKLDEEFQFATDFANGTWGDGVDEVFHSIDMENHLVGTQAGGHMFLPLNCRWSLFTNASVGVFNNHMRQDQRVSNADGWAYVNSGPYTGQNLRVRTHNNHTAVMGELRTGVHCQFSQRWRGTFIYRTMGLANVALPEHQIPGSFADLNDVRKVRGNGSVVLHGFMFGLETRF